MIESERDFEGFSKSLPLLVKSPDFQKDGTGVNTSKTEHVGVLGVSHTNQHIAISCDITKGSPLNAAGVMEQCSTFCSLEAAITGGKSHVFKFFYRYRSIYVCILYVHRCVTLFNSLRHVIA